MDPVSIFLGLLFALLRKFPEWIDPAPLPMELSRYPIHEKRLKELLERAPRFSDPVYKKNLQRRIERNRQFEEEREARNAPHSR